MRLSTVRTQIGRAYRVISEASHLSESLPKISQEVTTHALILIWIRQTIALLEDALTMLRQEETDRRQLAML